MHQDERNALLKYFYLIDTERLAENVNDKLHHSTAPGEMFQVMFSETKKACEKYTEFIWSPYSFNYPGGSRAVKDPGYSFDEILKNHCILHGFQSAVKEKADGAIKISGGKDSQLRKGCFGTGHFKDKPAPVSDDSDSDKTIYQNYNEYKHRFHNHPNSYSYCILKKSCTKSCTDFPTVPSHDGNWGCFIFTNKRVLTLDNNISSHSGAVLKNYGKLFEDSVQWPQIHGLLPEDSLLFESAMERIYGFHFFSYAAKLLHKVHTDSSSLVDGGITYKDLEGTMLLNVIQQAARLPAVYSRSFFLEYAIDSVMRSKYPKDHEYQEKPASLFSHISKNPASLISLLTSGFEHIRKYLQKLSCVALPLLCSVWDSLTDELNRKGGHLHINIDTYRNYIQKNLPSMHKDHSHYFQPEKPSDSAERSGNTDPIWQDFSFKGTLSTKYERDSFTTLLFDYLNTDRLIPHPNLYHMLTPYQDKIKELGKHTEELNFYKSHFENILSFAESITLPIKSDAPHQSDRE